MIYLDWNATAPLAPEARAAWLRVQEEAWGNPGSVHAFGQQARHALDQAKATLARLLGCATHEVVATSGGSEANATVITAALSAGGKAVCPVIEHSSVLRNLEAKADDLVCLGVDAEGRLDPAGPAFAAACSGAKILCVQFANNELGVRHDVAACAAAARAVSPDIWVHCDAAQGPGKVPLDLSALGVDSAALAGHKFGAPKGIGLLYVRRGRTLAPMIRGGRQQQDRRSGTEDAALLAAAAAALSARMPDLVGEAARQRALLATCFARIQAALPGIRWLASAADRVPNVLSLGHAGLLAEALVTRLDLAGFAVSKGSACMAAKGEPSHVIAALGLPLDLARSAIRVSIGWSTTAAELEAFADATVAEARAVLRAG